MIIKISFCFLHCIFIFFFFFNFFFNFSKISFSKRSVFYTTMSTQAFRTAATPPNKNKVARTVSSPQLTQKAVPELQV